MLRTFLLLIILTAGASVFAQHTFSICAVDPVTGEVGSAGASCISNSRIISDVHPGVGVVHTQAYYTPGNQNYAEELMDEGVSPEDIIDSVTANDIAGTPEVRQYGVVDLVDGGRSASYTGDGCIDWKGHITGPTYSIQGNILLGPEILDGMEEAFLNTEGNLACKLMAALQGAKTPGADTRCDTFNISALSSFLRVAKPGDDDGDLWLDIKVFSVNGANGIDPIDSLQQLFDEIGGCSYVAIENVPSVLEVHLYPLPVTGQFTFSSDAPISSIVLCDITGKNIATFYSVNSNFFTSSLKELQPGCYYYLLTTEDERTTTGKFLKL